MLISSSTRLLLAFVVVEVADDVSNTIDEYYVGLQDVDRILDDAESFGVRLLCHSTVGIFRV